MTVHKEFHKQRNPISIYNVDTKRIVLVFNKKSYNKIFIGYNTYHYYGVIPLYVYFPPKNTVTKYSENSKNMVVLVYDKDILNKCNTVWKKIQDVLKTQFISELIYEDNDKYIRTEVDLHNTPFLNKNKYKSKCYAWTSFLLLKSIFNINSKYYPVVFSNNVNI